MTAFPQLPLAERLSRRFGESVSRYDRLALAQRESAQVLLSRIEGGGAALDAGCGTGWLTAALAARDEIRQVVALDISPGMLQAERLAAAKIARVCADASRIPLPDDSVDILVSNFALQWLEHPQAFAREARRLLSSGGRYVLAIPVDGSLAEVASLWKRLGLRAPINRFPTAESWTRALTDAGLRVAVAQTVCFTQHHGSVRELLHAIRDIGAGERRDGQGEGLRGPGRLRALEAAAVAIREEAGIPLRYQVMFLEGSLA